LLILNTNDIMATMLNTHSYYILFNYYIQCCDHDDGNTLFGSKAID